MPSACDEPEREVDPRLGGVEHGVVVDHQPRARAGSAGTHSTNRASAGGRPLADRLDQRAAPERLVGDHEDRLHSWLSWLGGVDNVPAATRWASTGGLKIPCTAPGTPYS